MEKQGSAAGREAEAGVCGAQTRSGKQCGKAAGWGTSHVGQGRCKLHGGSTANHVKHAQAVAAAQAVELYGLPRDVDPHSALLEELARTAGHVDWLRLKVEEQGEDAMVGPVGTAGRTSEGLVHHPRGEPSVWLRLYQVERKHLAEVAATCIKAGIEERRVHLAEQQGQLIAQVLLGVLNELGIEQGPATRKVVRKHLALVSGGAE